MLQASSSSQPTETADVSSTHPLQLYNRKTMCISWIKKCEWWINKSGFELVSMRIQWTLSSVNSLFYRGKWPQEAAMNKRLHGGWKNTHFSRGKTFYLPKMVIIDCKYDRSPLKKIKHLGCTFIRSCGDVAFVKVFK